VVPPGEALVLSACEPISYETKTVGLLRGGLALDQAALARLRKATGVELALVGASGPMITTLEAAQLKDYTVLSAGVLLIGFTYVIVTLVGDVISALLNPRIRFEASE